MEERPQAANGWEQRLNSDSDNISPAIDGLRIADAVTAASKPQD